MRKVRGKSVLKMTMLLIRRNVPQNTVTSVRNAVEPKNTHNTVDCKRYEKDGVPKKAFKSKKGDSTVKKFNRQSFKTMEDTLKKTMKAEFKKKNKGTHKLKKRERDDLSDESNSS